MLDSLLPLQLGSRPRTSPRSLEVFDKYTGARMARVAVADDAMVDEAIAAAVGAQPEVSRASAHARRGTLLTIAGELARRREEFSRTLVAEVGKPISLARGEVDRAVDTFTRCAEEATRMGGAYEPLDVSPRGDGLEAIWRRVPAGVCSFITPFNFPLNLAAHKVGPAIAAGCAFILKPDERTPVTSLMLGEILSGTDLPAGAFSVLPCLEDGRDRFTVDGRLKLLSFTGSSAVGWKLKAAAGRKRVLLELGGNAACIVDAGVDLDRAAGRIVFGAFYQAGQSCISVQRVLAHESVYESLRDRIVAGARSLVARDPFDEASILGPLIADSEAQRVERWVGEAIDAGAELLTGGMGQGAWFEPTVLAKAPHQARVSCDEVFGPVVTIEPVATFDDAIDIANDSDFGLQAGVFTPSVDRAMGAFNRLEVGGVIVNDIPSTRVDAMPYGGVKGSGIGREGPRFAIEEMTELRLMVLRHEA